MDKYLSRQSSHKISRKGLDLFTITDEDKNETLEFIKRYGIHHSNESNRNNIVITTKYNQVITARQVYTLNPYQWVSDEIINLMMKMLTEYSYHQLNHNMNDNEGLKYMNIFMTTVYIQKLDDEGKTNENVQSRCVRRMTKFFE